MQNFFRSLNTVFKRKLYQTLFRHAPISAINLHTKWNSNSSNNDDKKTREYIYRVLEGYLKAGLVEKYYSTDQKELLYRPIKKKIILDLVEMKIITTQDDNV